MPRLVSRVNRILVCSAFSLSVVLGAKAAAQQPSGAAPASVDRVTGWRSDLAWWMDQLRKQHYVYRAKPLPADLLKGAEDLSRHIPDYSDDRVLYEFEHLASYVGDGHTYVLPLGAQRAPGNMLPLRFYLFSDGMFVIDANPGYEKWIGSKLVSIGPVTTAKILDGMKATISADNPFGYKWIGPPFLSLKGFLEYATNSRLGDSATVTVIDRAGNRQRVTLPFSPPPRMQGIPKLMASRLPGAPPVPLWLQDVKRNFWMKQLSSTNLYVQFNQVEDAPGHALKQAGAELDSALKTQKASTLILDVRHNNGGNSYLYPPVIDALTAWEAAMPQGKLYVLTGRNTFSAAQNFIAQLDKRTRAIFVGEPSSSKPNFVGEENDMQLPWSGAIASISNRYHENIPGDTRGWIEPAIKIELSSKDYFANRDPILDRLLRAR